MNFRRDRICIFNGDRHRLCICLPLQRGNGTERVFTFFAQREMQAVRTVCRDHERLHRLFLPVRGRIRQRDRCAGNTRHRQCHFFLRYGRCAQKHRISFRLFTFCNNEYETAFPSTVCHIGILKEDRRLISARCKLAKRNPRPIGKFAKIPFAARDAIPEHGMQTDRGSLLSAVRHRRPFQRPKAAIARNISL